MSFDAYKELAKDQYIIKVREETRSLKIRGEAVTFKEGMRVFLRSNPYIGMTIDSFQVQELYGISSVKAECVWLDSEKKLCRELFNLTSLSLHLEDVITENKE